MYLLVASPEQGCVCYFGALHTYTAEVHVTLFYGELSHPVFL